MTVDRFIFFSFTVSFVVHAPVAIFKTYTADTCLLIIGGQAVDKYYQIASIFAMYVLPLVIILLCYARILKIVWRKSSAGTESAAAHERSIKQKRKTTRMVFIVVLLFGLCWAPIHSVTLWFQWWPPFHANMSSAQMYALLSLQAFSMCLCYANSCVNPFIYAFTTTAFKKHFQKIFACWKIEDNESRVTEDTKIGATSGFKKTCKNGEYSCIKSPDTKV